MLYPCGARLWVAQGIYNFFATTWILFVNEDKKSMKRRNTSCMKMGVDNFVVLAAVEHLGRV